MYSSTYKIHQIVSVQLLIHKESLHNAVVPLH